jgi:RNA polymerase sigma factor (sigma-70 family)
MNQDQHRSAGEQLLEQSLPSLRRWAHGRLPYGARAHMDTCDLVQETALHMIAQLDAFTPEHPGAMRAYLRVAALNRIRDEARRIGRRPAPVELPEHLPCPRATPLEEAMEAETFRRYHEALSQLAPRDRDLVVARVERQWKAAEIAESFGFPTVDAARMAVKRALHRLACLLHESSPTPNERTN